MKDGGVVPKDKLSVTKLTPPGSTILLVKSSSPSATTPTWTSVTLTSSAVKKVSVTPYDKNGTPVGMSKEVIPDSSKPSSPLTVTFREPTVADRLVVTLTPLTPGDKHVVDVASVVSCMPDEGL